jgi:Holliday junction resolvasome RuvABC endonuclease subunit
MGIDPGTSNTGIAVISLSSSGKVKVLHLETVRTVAKQPTEERIEKILSTIESCIKAYGVRKVICEAFEVRTWQKPMKKSVVMSKLVNAISARVFDTGVPFMLSSPDTKRLFSEEDMERELKNPLSSYKIPYFTHAKDALRHVLYHTKVGGK